jgi:hypothetical protein
MKWQDVAYQYGDIYLKNAVTLFIIWFSEGLDVYIKVGGALLLTLTVIWTGVRIFRDYQDYKAKKALNNESKDCEDSGDG